MTRAQNSLLSSRLMDLITDCPHHSRAPPVNSPKAEVLTPYRPLLLASPPPHPQDKSPAPVQSRQSHASLSSCLLTLLHLPSPVKHRVLLTPPPECTPAGPRLPAASAAAPPATVVSPQTPAWAAASLSSLSRASAALSPPRPPGCSSNAHVPCRSPFQTLPWVPVARET